MLTGDIRRTDPGGGLRKEGPENKQPVMTRDRINIAKSIGHGGKVFMLPADQRPELPALQPLAMTKMKEGVGHVVGDDVMLPGLHVKWQHHKIDLIAEQAMLQVSIERKQRRVILAGVFRPLLKIDGKQGETMIRL